MLLNRVTAAEHSGQGGDVWRNASLEPTVSSSPQASPSSTVAALSFMVGTYSLSAAAKTSVFDSVGAVFPRGLGSPPADCMPVQVEPHRSLLFSCLSLYRTYSSPLGKWGRDWSAKVINATWNGVRRKFNLTFARP